MERKLQHMFHEHPLILKAKEPKTKDGTEKTNVDIKCNGCLTLLEGPFYSCGECLYYLHKACAELPNVLDNPMHPQHPLTLLSKPPHTYTNYYCNMCSKTQEGFDYRCSKCDYDLDTICAATSHTIKDECHMHPLIPIQTHNVFFCHICLKEEKGVSYKCTVCSFWVHQSCTLLPNTVKHSYHHHHLTLLPSLPIKNWKYSEKCDICYSELVQSHCSYSCESCLFYAHASCATSETTPSSSRDQKLPPDGQCMVFLPIKQITTDVKDNFIEDPDANADNKIDHFDHEHPLFLIEEQINEKTCDACATAVSSPFYGCRKCDYFLHKRCAELPKNIDHPLHPQHKLTLGSMYIFFPCNCCDQWCNGFTYKCLECENIHIDIKCASLLGSVFVYHEAHKHPMIPRFTPSDICSICGGNRISECILECNTCKFILCFECAMTPPIMNHRCGKIHPFILTYSPPENHYNEYICEICEGVLNPKRWFYHCVYADQFTHTWCMRECGADSNIKYGKSFTKLDVHEHKLTFVSCTFDISLCTYCREPLRTGFSVGFECIPCNIRIHLECFNPMRQNEKRSTNSV